MKIKLLFICIFCIGIGSLSAQTIRYVKPQSSGNGSGTSWGNASSNLQSMITASAAGDQVWIAAGTYRPGDQYSNRSVTFALKSGVKVYGSFAGNETSVQQRNIAANPTILSGDLTGNDVPSSNPMLLSGNTTMSTNAYHVVTAGGLNKNSVFDGFTITGGYANDTSSTANGSGGGIYVSGSEGTFSNLIIKSCYAFFGGGIYLTLNDGVTPRFNGIWISECSAGANGENDGSAVYKQFNSGSPEFFNMVVSNCAGGTAVSATNASITNSTFYNIYTGSTLNYPYDAVVYGANMYNCIIGQHSLPYAVYNVTNKYLENNSFYGVVQAGTETWYRKENITNNGNAGFVNAANGNFRLTESSPCIGTGDPENLNLYSSISKGYTAITTDIAGNAREIGTVDMGAYEYGQLSKRYVKQTASGTGDGSSWENASNDLQLMINQSAAGDQIWVAKGTYKPVRQPNSSAFTPNNRDNTFFLKSGVKIYGSFAGGETTTNGRNFQLNATILSGDFSNNDPDNTTNAGVLASSSLINENAHHVVVGVDVQNIVFDGFVLKGGIANGTGVIAFGDAWNPRDVARDFGGGLYLIRTQGEFNNVAVRSSLATSGGGGIFTDNSPVYLPRFNGLIITGCVGGAAGTGNGSAFYADGSGGSSISGVEIFNMLVTNCVGASSVYVTTTNAVAYITNATFYGVSVDNASFVNAAVIETASGGSVVLNNSIIGYHLYPYAFNIGWGSNITSYSSNSSIYKTKRGQGTFTPTNNTTNTGNPGFISPTTGDFGLTSASAVRNLGNVAFLTTTLGSQYQYTAVNKDIIGNPRLFQGNLDLGAYQYKPACDIPAPPVAADQTLCNGSTVASLVANGTGIKWYLNATGGSALSSSTTLSTRGYFVSQTTGVCESDRVEISVTIPAAPAAPSIGEQILCGPSTVAKLIALYPNFRWYAASTGGTQLTSSAALTHNTYYYASQVNVAGCESTSRTGFYVRIGTIPATPTATSSQSFCGTAKVSDLQSSAASPRWFTAATGGFALSSNTAIATGTYYVAQMGTYCESPRIAVEVTVTSMPQAPVASAQTFCGSARVNNLVASGTNHTWYDSSFNTLVGVTPLSNGTYYVTQTVNGCVSAATAVNVTLFALPAAPTAAPQSFCGDVTVAMLVAKGSNLKWYATATGGNALTPDAGVSTGTYYVTQSNANCESERVAVSITVHALPAAPVAPGLQTFCGTATIDDLTSQAPETKWYTAQTGGTALAQGTPITTGTYYAAQMNVMCESLRTPVEVVVAISPTAPVAEDQLQCTTGTVADLISTGVNLKWYTQAEGGDALNETASLTDGVYYVSQTIGDCESARTAITVTLQNCTTLTAAYCNAAVGFNSTVTATAMTGATQYRFRVVNGNNVQVIDKAVRNFRLNELDSYGYNVIYTVRVAVLRDGQWSGYGPACTVTVVSPQARLKEVHCGTPAASLTSFIYAEPVTLAEAYRFRIVEEGQAPQIIEGTGRSFRINQIVGNAHNKAYVVDVAVKIGNTWTAYGPACTIYTPQSPTTRLKDAHCNGTVSNLSAKIYASLVDRATAYRFRITNGANVQVINGTANMFQLKMITGAAFHVTYTVEVAVQIDGSWGLYGPQCTITAIWPGGVNSRPGTAVTTDANDAEAEIQPIGNEVTLTAYPNPYTDAFTVEMNTQSAEKVTVRAFDMNGRLVEDITLSASELAMQKFGNGLMAGIYNVMVSQGTYQKSFRIVKR